MVLKPELLDINRLDRNLLSFVIKILLWCRCAAGVVRVAVGAVTLAQPTQARTQVPVPD